MTANADGRRDFADILFQIAFSGLVASLGVGGAYLYCSAGQLDGIAKLQGIDLHTKLDVLVIALLIALSGGVVGFYFGRYTRAFRARAPNTETGSPVACDRTVSVTSEGCER